MFSITVGSKMTYWFC